ncbi:G-protein-signaling modulator 1 [Parelaphostrongylus tenuis]|uniref:G-protein-signaling modulator 1 n=1 Tax=Parelaphostrongylus tenuis TaxID=148309 RepID=A0AAD5RI15_PARTN|nr:G-protein-signaling modulator 1 [Parelaphostrongylus tenuis]
MVQVDDDGRQPTFSELTTKGELLWRERNFQDAIPTFVEALSLGTEDLNLLSCIYSQLGHAYLSTGDIQNAYKYHCCDIMVSRLMNDRAGESRACGNVVLILSAQRLFDDALIFAKRQIAIAETVEDPRYLANGLYNLGAIYTSRAKQLKTNAGLYEGEGGTSSGFCRESSTPFYRKNLYQAFDCYCKCIRIYLKLSDRLACGRIYNCLGNILQMLGHYKSAAEYQCKRLSIALTFHDADGKYKSYINLGNACILLSDAKKAAEFYLSALKIAEESSDKQREAKSCFCLAYASYIIQDYDTATLYYFRSLTLFRELKDLVGMCRTYGDLATLYTMLADYPKAAYFLLCRRAVAIQIHDKEMETTAVKSLTILVEKHKDVLILEGGYVNLDSSDDTEPQVHFCRLKTVSRSISFIFNKPSSGYVHFNDATHERSHSLESANAEHAKTDDAFFDLVSRVQSSRLDEQRCDMSVPSSKAIAGRRQTDCTKTAQNDHERVSWTDCFVWLLRRMFEVLFYYLFLRTTVRLHRVHNEHRSASDKDDDAKVEEALINLLMNELELRMDDQRTDLTADDNNPVVCGSLDDYGAEDDLSEMVMRMQARRLDEQRADLMTANKLLS